MLTSVAAISLGAAAGAISRWLLGLAFNNVFPLIPLGTLLANLIGGYMIGLVVSLFAFWPELGAHARLLVITGFLGALTTFSTFSAEVVSLLQQGRVLMAFLAVSVHVCGSLMMTFLGIGTFSLFRMLLR